jgi:threonine dehydratase
MTLPDISEVRAAAAIVHEAMAGTPQIRWPRVCERTGAAVWIKHENQTPLGAFKIRGGLVYMDHLQRTEPGVPGVIAATRGNHGQSVAFAAVRLGLRVVIVVPHGNSRTKNAAMRKLGAELVEHGEDFQEAFEYAAGMAEAQGLHFVRSFNRGLVLGAATYALELFEAVPDLDAVYVPIGMGSGICGTIAARNALGLETEVVGVVAAGAQAYGLSFAAGRPVSTERAETVADGMACRVPDADAVRIVVEGASRMVTVDDGEIRAAMRFLFTDTGQVAEGSGAAPLAALLEDRARMKGRRVALILSGGNVDEEIFEPIVAGAGAGGA